MSRSFSCQTGQRNAFLIVKVPNVLASLIEGESSLYPLTGILFSLSSSKRIISAILPLTTRECSCARSGLISGYHTRLILPFVYGDCTVTLPSIDSQSRHPGTHTQAPACGVWRSNEEIGAPHSACKKQHRSSKNILYCDDTMSN